jgi:glycosyltransferase involved in cell wall biosynthesis
MNILWTIGILHLPKRANFYNALMSELNKQIKLLNAENIIEIITETDNGENSVGKKRNNVIDKAKGEYVCFIDDDDMITDIYVSKTLKALETKPDVVELVEFKLWWSF